MTPEQQEAYRTAQERIEACRRSGQPGLSLSNLALSALPPAIGQLSALTELYLQSNQLSALPPEIGRLPALTVLYLSGNQLVALPPEIGRLAALKVLSLSENQLRTLPPEIGQLSALSVLLLDDNPLATVPEELRGCQALENISLENTKLTRLPGWLRELPKLTHLLVAGNAGLGLPPEVVGERRHDWGEPDARQILDYYFSLREQGERPLNEVKLLFLGRGGAGKTATVNRLLGRGFVPGTKETVGIDITDWKMDCPGGEAVTVHGWDFAGQTVTHGLHVFFLSQRSVYVLVLSGREDTAGEDAEYWLKLMEAYARNAEDGEVPPVLVALNKWENGEQRPLVDRRGLEEKYPFIAGWVETDCRTGLGYTSGAVGLPDRLREVIGQRQWVRAAFPKGWHDAKEHFSKMKEDYLSFGSFQALAVEKGVEPEKVRSFARTLHQLGIALNFAEDERLKDTTVLNPHWVTGTIYKVLREGPRPGDAVLTLDHVAEVLPKEEPHMRAFAVELMRRFDLAFPLPERDNAWLVPARLPEEQPEGIAEGFGEGVAGATRVRFAVNPLPKMILPGFITRTHILSDDLPKWRWVNGVVLALDGAQALVRADHADRMVSITLTGKPEARPTLASLCRRELASLFDAIPGLEPKEEMEVRPGAWTPVALMEELERDNQEKLPVLLATGKVEMVQVRTELDRIRPLAARDEGVWKPSIFISYAHRDSRMKDELVMRLKIMQGAGLVGEVWHDRMLEPGEEWSAKIEDKLRKADLVILLVSTPALASDYIRQQEMALTFSLAKEMVPVVLEPCQWQLVPELKKGQVLPTDAKPLRSYKPQTAGWHIVMEALHKKVAGLKRR